MININTYLYFYKSRCFDISSTFQQINVSLFKLCFDITCCLNLFIFACTRIGYSTCMNPNITLWYFTLQCFKPIFQIQHNLALEQFEYSLRFCLGLMHIGLSNQFDFTFQCLMFSFESINILAQLYARAVTSISAEQTLACKFMQMFWKPFSKYLYQLMHSYTCSRIHIPGHAFGIFDLYLL